MPIAADDRFGGTGALAATQLTGATVAVLDNPSIVDTGGSSSNESDTIQATLAQFGHTAAPFTGLSAADFSAAVAGGQVLLFPEMERGQLTNSTDATAEAVIRDFVSAGGTLVVSLPSTNSINSLNDIFGFGLVQSGAGVSSLTAQANGTTFEGGPASLTDANATRSLETSSLPAGSLSIYASGADTMVATMPFGNGQIVVLGYDWYNAAPLGSQTGGWLTVLDRAISTADTAPFATADAAVVLPEADLLDNDSDAESDPLSISAVDATSTLGAAVTLNPDGSLTYDPTGAATILALAEGDTLEDTFSYTLSDGTGGTDTATVTVGVGGADGDPILTGPAPDLSVTGGGVFTRQIAGGLFSDPTDHVLTYDVTQADGSALPAWLSWDAATRQLTGTVPGGMGTLSLRVTATEVDGQSNSTTFDFSWAAPLNLTGTPGPDSLTGNVANDTLTGLEGNDTLVGDDGDDQAFGNDGNDEVHGDNGNDTLYGGDGDDMVFGGAGFDTLFGGEGNDTVQGGNGRDWVGLGDGDDLFNDNDQGGVNGRDTVYANDGNDTIQGGRGDDWFYGQGGNDLIFGRLAWDRIWGGSGEDTLNGGDGNDTIEGGDDDDRLIGEDGNDLLRGQLGDDMIFGGAGDDSLRAGRGDDTAYGGEGNDSIRAGYGNDVIFDGDGDDTVDGQDGNDSVFGGAGNDRVWLGWGDDLFDATGQSGDDTVSGSDGNDTVRGGTGNDSFTGGWGDDTLRGNEGNDTLDGGYGHDLVVGGDGNDEIQGGFGQDTIVMGAGDDIYIDTAQAGPLGQDWITGGAGADTFVFGLTMSRDRITDFEVGVDTLQLNERLWAGNLTEAEVIANFATVTAQGVVLDFGFDHIIILEGLTSTAGLAGDLVLV